MYLIYKHTCTVTNKCYIGLTKHSIEYRWRQHVSCAKTKKKNLHFYNAINLYGELNWEHEVLVKNIQDYKKACKLERFFIKKYNSLKCGYNSTVGGAGCVHPSGNKHPLYGVKKTKEHINKSVFGRAKSRACWTDDKKTKVKENYRKAQYKRYNSKKYMFYNPELDIIEYDYVSIVANKHQLHQGYLRYVALGKSKHTNGWFLWVGESGEYIKDPVYTFKHKKYGVEVLTIKAMSEKYNLSKGNLCMVAKGKRKHTCGWEVVLK